MYGEWQLSGLCVCVEGGRVEWDVVDRGWKECDGVVEGRLEAWILKSVKGVRVKGVKGVWWGCRRGIRGVKFEEREGGTREGGESSVMGL